MLTAGTSGTLSGHSYESVKTATSHLSLPSGMRGRDSTSSSTSAATTYSCSTASTGSPGLHPGVVSSPLTNSSSASIISQSLFSSNSHQRFQAPTFASSSSAAYRSQSIGSLSSTAQIIPPSITILPSTFISKNVGHGSRARVTNGSEDHSRASNTAMRSPRSSNTTAGRSLARQQDLELLADHRQSIPSR